MIKDSKLYINKFVESIGNTMTLSSTKEHSMNSHHEDLVIMPLKLFQELY